MIGKEERKKGSKNGVQIILVRVACHRKGEKNGRYSPTQTINSFKVKISKVYNMRFLKLQGYREQKL